MCSTVLNPKLLDITSFVLDLCDKQLFAWWCYFLC